MSVSADLIAYHGARGLLVDTNLLLVYAIGLFDRKSVGQHKRTRQYSGEDFDLLKRFIDPFRRIVTTPHILAELSNLANIGRTRRLGAQIAVLLETIRRTKELYVEKDTLLELDCFPELGVADAGILELAKRDHRLIHLELDEYGQWVVLEPKSD